MHTEPDEKRLNDLAARRFPLVARPQVISRPIPVRISQIETRAAQAQQGGPDTITRAAEALNLAALLASDVGTPEAARDLCWRQFAQFQNAARPLPVATAQLALQPLINLARLHTRAGHGRTAFDLLHELFAAVINQTAVKLDGHLIDLAGFTRPGDDHTELRTWLWQVFLIDGTNALARAGEWNHALHYVDQLHGIVHNLGEGRQIAILAHALGRQPNQGLDLLRASRTGGPWEQTVALCLTALCLQAGGHSTDKELEQITDTFLELDREPALATATGRLGLAALELQYGQLRADAPRITQRLWEIGMEPGGGYVARDLLQHHMSASLSEGRRQDLVAAVRLAGLDGSGLSADFESRLLAAADASTAALERDLRLAADLQARHLPAGSHRPGSPAGC